MSHSQKPPSTAFTYKDAGVDIDAGNALVDAIKPFAKATIRPGADGALGGFGGLFDLKSAGFSDPILVAANDGVGTKIKIAIEMDKHDTIGIDLVAMCVNDLIVQGAEPLFFLDYFATGKLEPGVAESVISGISHGCVQAGAALIGGETAEMPGLYAEGDYDLAGFSVGAAERGKLLPKATLQAGDVLIGLKSSGPHSNGYSLIRKIVDHAKLDWNDPAPFAEGQSVGDAFLTPTRIYIKPILEIMRETDGVKALAHITGGGILENVPRVLPDHLAARFTLDGYSLPAVFEWLSAAGSVSQFELLRTFNCGIGMVIAAASADSDFILSRLNDLGEEAILIGDVVERGDGEPVQVLGLAETS